MRLIGIAGPARAGKDTVANLLLDNLPPYWQRAAFADPMRAMLRVIGVDCSDDAKSRIDPRYGCAPRHLMQTLGTEWGRNLIGPDIWVQAFKQQYNGRAVIVSDVRFENEAALIREYGHLIHIVGRGGIAGGHISEAGVGVVKGDTVINNSYDMLTLIKGVNDLARDPVITAAPIYKLRPEVRRFDHVVLPRVTQLCPYGALGDLVEAAPGKYLKIVEVKKEPDKWVLKLA